MMTSCHGQKTESGSGRKFAKYQFGKQKHTANFSMNKNSKKIRIYEFKINLELRGNDSEKCFEVIKMIRSINRNYGIV